MLRMRSASLTNAKPDESNLKMRSQKPFSLVFLKKPSYLILMKGRLTKFWIYDAVVIIYSGTKNAFIF